MQKKYQKNKGTRSMVAAVVDTFSIPARGHGNLRGWEKRPEGQAKFRGKKGKKGVIY